MKDASVVGSPATVLLDCRIEIATTFCRVN